MIPLALMLAAIVAAVWGIPRLFAEEPAAKRGGAKVASAAVVVEPLRDPTPLIASYSGLDLHLPVDPSDITAFAFHQASNPRALHMKSLVPFAKAEVVAADAKKKPGAKPANSPSAEEEAAEGGIPTVYEGRALKLWRSSRTGAPDTAADCGAKAGTEVYAPVTGKVIGVRRYKLYGKYGDYEVHIQPDGRPKVDVVLLHIDDVVVSKGDRVTGGVTRIARIRLLSDRITHQLSTYTGEPGDHVHIQLNRLEKPGKLPPLNGPS